MCVCVYVCVMFRLSKSKKTPGLMKLGGIQVPLAYLNIYLNHPESKIRFKV